MAKSNIKIHFLGTGTSQGIPIIGSSHPVCLSSNPKDKRLRSSLLLEKNGKIITIDSGPDFRQQMLRYNAQRLDGIVYTHEHNDHVLGLDDIRPLVFKSGEDMNVYGLKRVLDELHHRELILQLVMVHLILMVFENVFLFLTLKLIQVKY